MLDRAKFLVVSEISEVTDEEAEEVEAKVSKALVRCLANRTRLLTKAKTAKAKTAKARVKKSSSRTTGRRAAKAS